MESNNVEQLVIQRRSASYLPTVWDNEFIINSINTPYSYENESDGKRLEELKQDVLCLFTSLNRPEEKLDMINKMQRLDIAKHFENEINEFLITHHLNPDTATDDLFTVALHFRLLRQHGLSVTSDVFRKFMNSDMKFEERLSEDVIGLLSLYEASYLEVHGEEDGVLEEAKSFATQHLRLAIEKLDKENIELAQQIKESLHVPLYWRLPRTEARNFIHIYQRDENHNSVLLQLAKLDFNILQSLYLQELKELAEWWKEVNVEENLPFTRDRLVECYFWALGVIPQPKYNKCRRNLTKYGALATVIDDVFDIYGSMDELNNYNTAVKRWDVEAIEELPEYMKVCYKAMYNHVNEMVEDASNDVGIDILPYLKDQWVCYIQSIHVEAGWFYGGYGPSFDECLKNASISVGVCPGLTYAFLAVLQESDSLNHSQLQLLFDHWSESDIFYLPSSITRFFNDLATHKVEVERGEMAKTVRCYMRQEGVCEEEARDEIKGLIRKSWKKLNKFVADPSLPKGFFEIALGMTRCSQIMYQFGDLFGIQTQGNQDCLNSSLFNHV